MKWSLLDGSPRGRRSNTSILFGNLSRGLQAAGHTVEVRHLTDRRDNSEAPEYFANAEAFLLGFPLYVDSMPGQVMEFIERLEPYIGRTNNPKIAFLVQSGFPEPGQSRAVEAYLKGLAERLDCEYLGTIVKGGVEGIQAMPPVMTKNLFQQLEAIGKTLGREGKLDPRQLRALAGPEWYRGWRTLLLRASLRFFAAPYWNRLLKKNGAYDRRFARPYQDVKP